VFKKFLLTVIAFGAIVAIFAFNSKNHLVIHDLTNGKDSSCSSFLPYNDVYDSLHLQKINLSEQAFSHAISGYQKLLIMGKIKNPDIITIADFSQPSTSKRLYIINLRTKKLIENTLVAHGRNTGQLMATNFSNIPESNQSSLGFYVTSERYHGKHGLSLRLDGMEKNINDLARDRAIVMHGADYATENFCKQNGYLGRSFGCPAVPTALSLSIINTICGGSCLFIYHPDQRYIKKSSLA